MSDFLANILAGGDPGQEAGGDGRPASVTPAAAANPRRKKKARARFRVVGSFTKAGEQQDATLTITRGGVVLLRVRYGREVYRLGTVSEVAELALRRAFRAMMERELNARIQAGEPPAEIKTA